MNGRCGDTTPMGEFTSTFDPALDFMGDDCAQEVCSNKTFYVFVALAQTLPLPLSADGNYSMV